MQMEDTNYDGTIMNGRAARLLMDKSKHIRTASDLISTSAFLMQMDVACQLKDIGAYEGQTMHTTKSYPLWFLPNLWVQALIYTMGLSHIKVPETTCLYNFQILLGNSASLCDESTPKVTQTDPYH